MSVDTGSRASMPVSGSEPGDCVERWLLGDDESFEEVFNQYYRLVVGFFTKRGFTPQEAEDLTQIVFLRVYKARESFRGEARFSTWLFQICANVFRNNLRDRSTQKRDAEEVSMGLSDSSALEGLADGGADPLHQTLSAEARGKLRTALSDLPPQMRRCVELRVYEDLKYREIAERMKISIDTVKAHLFQARQILKGTLGDYFTDFDL